MKRKIISILLTSVMVMTLFSSVCTVASAVTVRNLSSYIVSSAVPTDFDISSHNGGTGTVTYTDGQNNSRIFTLSGTSGTGNNYATGTGFHFGFPELGEYPVNGNASAKGYILHFSYRIQNDRTKPADILHRVQYKNASNGGSPKDIFYSNSTQLTMNDDNSKNITSSNASSYNNLDFYDFKVDIYENLKTGIYQIYINGVKWMNGYDYDSAKNMFGSSSNVISEFRLFVKQTGAAYSFNVVNPCFELYSADTNVIMDDVIAATVSGMSNYLNISGPSSTYPITINQSSSLTATAISGGYSLSSVKSGGYLRWWDITPKMYGSTEADKAWLHMGFDITGNTSFSTRFKFQYFTASSTATTGDSLISFSGTSYREDLFFDLATNTVYKYKDRVYQGADEIGYTQATQMKNIYFYFSNALTSCTMSNMVFETYAKGVTPGDMLIGYETRTKTTYDYFYNVSGIKTGGNAITRMGGICSVSGDNSSGYTLAPNSINANNGGFARMWLTPSEDDAIYQSTGDKVLIYSAYYKPSVVSSGSKHYVGIRGNNGYLWFLTAYNGAFYNYSDSGYSSSNYIKPYSTSTFYRIDFILNNKDYKYYWLLDGVCFNSGTLSVARQPLWNIVYTMWNTADRIVLKNVQTSLYTSSYTLLSKVKPLLSTDSIYANLESCSVSNNNATVTTSYIANTSTTLPTSDTKILYGIYNSSGSLLKYQVKNSANTYVNGSNATETISSIPTGSTTLKVFMWNMNLGNGTMTPIANVLTTSLQ